MMRTFSERWVEIIGRPGELSTSEGSNRDQDGTNTSCLDFHSCPDLTLVLLTKMETLVHDTRALKLGLGSGEEGQ